MRLSLITGFLGAGKTTLVQELLRSAGDREKVALIVNEFGRAGIDGDILRGSALDMVELSSGCICCELKGSMLAALRELETNAAPDLVIVEASGVAEPSSLVPELLDAGVTLLPICTVADASRLERMLANMGPFYRQQIEAADVVVLNKCDLISDREQIAAERRVLEVNLQARVLTAEHCRFDVEPLLTGRSLRAERMREGTSDAHAHDVAFSTLVEMVRPVSRRALEQVLDDAPDTLWRAKGYVSIDGRTHLVQVSSGGLEIESAEQKSEHRLVLIGPDRQALDSLGDILSELGSD